ncbi:hypothetical protein [Streptomyces sp. NPDC057429]|uniref:hypothetical protein n=1 Tax=Streptomyces sp. NPDC057429 TaxID=3346130 RepID=UPI00368CCA5B
MRVSARLRHRFHRTARLLTARRSEPGSLPALQMAGVLVFAYIDADSSAVRVSVDLDTAHRALLRPDRSVPLEITVQGSRVFRG